MNREILDTKKGKTIVKLNHIIYIESMGHYVIYYLINGIMLKERNTMDSLMREFGEGLFVRCHRSFIINLRFIRNIKDDVELSNGQVVSVGRKWRACVMGRYVRYREREAI